MVVDGIVHTVVNVVGVYGGIVSIQLDMQGLAGGHGNLADELPFLPLRGERTLRQNG